jgi:hypothetical protein
MPSGAKGWTDINDRYGGKLNIVRCDTSAKTLDSKKGRQRHPDPDVHPVHVGSVRPGLQLS